MFIVYTKTIKQLLSITTTTPFFADEIEVRIYDLTGSLNKKKDLRSQWINRQNEEPNPQPQRIRDQDPMDQIPDLFRPLVWSKASGGSFKTVVDRGTGFTTGGVVDRAQVRCGEMAVGSNIPSSLTVLT